MVPRALERDRAEVCRRLRLFPLTVTPLVFAAVTTFVRAGVIVDHPFDPTNEGAYTNLVPGEPFHQQLANSFRISEPVTLETILWVGRYDGPVTLSNPIAFTIRLFADNPRPPLPPSPFPPPTTGLPELPPLAESEVMVNASPTGAELNGFPWFAYTAHMRAALNPGVHWLSIVESDPRTAAIAGSQWMWAHSTDVPIGVEAGRISDDQLWGYGNPVTDAFALTGTAVPEPSTFGFGLLALGLAWVCGRKCRT